MTLVGINRVDSKGRERERLQNRFQKPSLDFPPAGKFRQPGDPETGHRKGAFKLGTVTFNPRRNRNKDGFSRGIAIFPAGRIA